MKEKRATRTVTQLPTKSAPELRKIDVPEELAKELNCGRHPTLIDFRKKMALQMSQAKDADEGGHIALYQRARTHMQSQGLEFTIEEIQAASK